MTDLPLGIVDLYNNLPPTPLDNDHWYWCRYHGCAEHVSEPSDIITVGAPTMYACIRIGPFMSKSEAERLDIVHGCPHCDDGPYISSLGMGIEQDA